MQKNYYYDTEANNDPNIRVKAIVFANSIAEKDSSINRIVLYFSKKESEWFNNIFSEKVIKKLFKDNGRRFKEIKVPVKIETKVTYKKCYGTNDIVICYGTMSKGLYDLEDNDCVKYIISIPWIKSQTEEWIKSRNAVNVETGEASHIELPTSVVIEALKDLTDSINLGTGIIDPTDNELAKTYIRALHEYEKGLNGTIVSAYLVNHLNWETRHAQDVRHLIDRLNEGRTFKGGAKTGLDRKYKRWQEDANKKETTD